MIVNRRYGSSINLPAHWEGGARTTSLLAAHLAKRNTKFGGGGTPEAIPLLRDATGQKARAGKNFYPVGSRSDSFGAFPPTPFLFARLRQRRTGDLKVFQNSAFGFSLKKVQISFRVIFFLAGHATLKLFKKQ